MPLFAKTPVLAAWAPVVAPPYPPYGFCMQIRISAILSVSSGDYMETSHTAVQVSIGMSYILNPYSWYTSVIATLYIKP